MAITATATAPPAGLRSTRRMPPAVALPAAFVAFGSLLPVAYLVIVALTSGRASLDVLTASSTWAAAARSLGLAVCVTAAACAIAVPAAVAVSRTNLPGRRILEVLLPLPLVVPSFLGAFAFASMFGARGLLQQVLSSAGIERLPDFRGFWAAFLVLTLFTYPYVYLPVVAALRDLDASVEEAARSLGTSAWQALRRAVLPQLRPAVVAGALLVALYTLADFGAVSILRFKTLTVVLFQDFDSFDPDRAIVLGLVLVAITFAIVRVGVRGRGRLRLAASARGTRRPAALLDLGTGRRPASGGGFVLVALSVGVTVVVLALWTIQGILHGNALPPELWQALFNTFAVSAVAAIATVAAALPIAVAVARHPSRLSSVLERSAWAGHALPGVVVALALASFALDWVPPLYQTLLLLEVAYVIHFVPQALGGATAALGRVDPGYEEASRSLGRSWGHTFVTVTLPLLLRSLLAAGALVLLNVMKELPMTLALRPIGMETLATVIYPAAQNASYTKAGAAGLVLLLVASVPMALVTIREIRRG